MKTYLSLFLPFIFVILFSSSCIPDKATVTNYQTTSSHYPAFYRGMIDIKALADFDHFEEALTKFDSLAEKIPHIPSGSLMSAVRISVKAGECKRAAEYLELALKNGYEYEVEGKTRTPYSDCEEILNEILARESAIHQKYFNYSYRAEIDSMFTLEQQARKNEISANAADIDSSNFVRLQELIEKHGFPGEKIIGKETAFYAYIIMLHMDRDIGNKILKPILTKAYNEGDLGPIGYAWIVDRRRNWGPNNLEPYFYHMPSSKLDSLTVAEQNEVNRRRDSIGLEMKMFIR